MILNEYPPFLQLTEHLFISIEPRVGVAVLFQYLISIATTKLDKGLKTTIFNENTSNSSYTDPPLKKGRRISASFFRCRQKQERFKFPAIECEDFRPSAVADFNICID
jgi:hypothetical protein